MSSRVLLIGELSTTSIIRRLLGHLGIIPFFDVLDCAIELIVRLFHL